MVHPEGFEPPNPRPKRGVISPPAQALPLEGIEPPSTVPKTVALSVKLQGRAAGRHFTTGAQRRGKYTAKLFICLTLTCLTFRGWSCKEERLIYREFRL